MFEERKDKFRKALNQFIDDYKDDDNVVGILLTGSFLHSEPDKNSDLDVYIVLEESDFRERGNTWIDGVEIEYFINPIEQVKEYFRREREGVDSPSAAHMFTNCEVLYKGDEVLDDLIDEAEDVMEESLSEMNEFEVETARYQMDDLRKDLEDVYLKEDWFGFELVASEVLDKSLKYFCEVNEILKEKPKRVEEQLESVDGEFARVYRRAVLKRDFEQRYRALNNLIDYVEDLLGGKRPKEWSLKSECTV